MLATLTTRSKAQVSSGGQLGIHDVPGFCHSYLNYPIAVFLQTKEDCPRLNFVSNTTLTKEDCPRLNFVSNTTLLISTTL